MDPLAFHDDSTTNTNLAADENHVVSTATGSEAMFSERAHIGIVANRHGDTITHTITITATITESSAHQFGERDVAPLQVGRHDDVLPI